MKVKVLYFGHIAEIKGVQEEVKEMGQSYGLQDLIDLVVKEIPKLRDMNYVVALNQVIVAKENRIQEGDEVSFFPPFAGG
ncbi:MAG: molybdopterin converting factor small subunit [Salibacteraceae bacterium]|jgi:molybdopterin converting factor small subunit